jgi:two-component system, OmpR family, response regulator ArlR
MRILLVEDDRSLSRAVSTILQKNNYTVDCVDNGQLALDYLEQDIYDMVIMDIMMPVMDGITALKNLRKRGNNIPVLMLTAKTEIDDKVEGLDNGANDYLTKPFDTRELLARIRVLTRSEKQQDNVITLGNISLNTTTCELSSPSGSFLLVAIE